MIGKASRKRHKGERRTAAIAALTLVVCSLQAEAVEKPRIAIIIDDLGYSLQLGLRVTGLPGRISCAVLPATPRGKTIAEEAYAAGKEVLLHLPLEAVNEGGRPEPGSISLDMSRGEFGRAFADDLLSVPHAIGVNSHRGSLLTQHPGHMTWLMEEIVEHGDLIFVDSYTTHESVALPVAIEAGVAAVKRDVFLDPDESLETIAREFARLKKIARDNGFAVGIGHPYPVTLDFLERELPGLDAEGIELISIGELVRLKTRQGVAVTAKQY